MNNNLIIQIGKQLDLNPAEIKLYLEINSNPKISISKLAKKLDISRVTIYKYLDNLTRKNLIEKYNKNIYLPQSPKKILTLLKSKQEENLQTQNQFSQILPDLLGNFYTGGNKNHIRYFEGLSQYKIILNELLITKNEILLLGNDQEFAQIIGWENYHDWITHRVSKKIPFREITYPFPEYENYKYKNQQELRQVKFLNLKNQTPGSMIINDKIISIWNPIHPRVIVIEDSVLNNFLKSIFEILWEQV